MPEAFPRMLLEMDGWLYIRVTLIAQGRAWCHVCRQDYLFDAIDDLREQAEKEIGCEIKEWHWINDTLIKAPGTIHPGWETFRPNKRKPS